MPSETAIRQELIDTFDGKNLKVNGLLLRRLPENLKPDDAGLRFAFEEHCHEHSRAM